MHVFFAFSSIFSVFFRLFRFFSFLFLDTIRETPFAKPRDSRLFSENRAFGKRRFSHKTADFAGYSQKTADWHLPLFARENQTCTKLWLLFCVAFAPLSLGGVALFPVQENLPFLWEVLLFLHDLLYESTVFPPPGNWGQKVTRNGGPEFGACLILSELIFPAKRRPPYEGYSCNLGFALSCCLSKGLLVTQDRGRAPPALSEAGDF